MYNLHNDDFVGFHYILLPVRLQLFIILSSYPFALSSFLSSVLGWTGLAHYIKKASLHRPFIYSSSGIPAHHTSSLFLVFCLIRSRYLAPVNLVACRVIFLSPDSRSALPLSHYYLILNPASVSFTLPICKNSCSIIVFSFLIFYWSVWVNLLKAILRLFETQDRCWEIKFKP